MEQATHELFEGENPMNMATDPSLTPFFHPKGIVIIGASHNPTKLGYGLARNLVRSGYKGAVHFVNPKGGTLFEQNIYPDVESVPEPVDLAVLLIPAPTVPQTLEACGQRGIHAAIVISGGFRETGAKGTALEEACLAIAQKHNMRILGPNCIGLLDTHLPLDTTFLPPPGPIPGEVAFISHSGAICAAVIDWVRGQGLGLSRLVSLGNQVDVSETDMIGPVADDPYTKVITMYLEGVSNGRQFVTEAARITPKKPVIALRVGRFESGQRAVASHTGALTGQENAFNAAFRRAGVLRAETTETMFDWARALAWCPSPKGPEVAVLTNAGGPGVTAADALEANGLNLAQLNPITKAALQELLPPAASIHNPVDMLASASPELYAQCLQILLDDKGVHSVMVVLPNPPMYTAGGVARAIIPVISTSEKPVIVALMGSRLIQEAAEHLQAARVPEYRFPERAASALSALTMQADIVNRPQEAPLTSTDVNQQAVINLLRQFKPADISETAITFLPQQNAINLISAYGLQTPPTELASTLEEAVQVAQKVGYPVVLKIASPDIIHKTEMEGVLLNLKNTDEVVQGFKTLIPRAQKTYPKAKIQGVHIQPMIPEGQEVILGVIQDKQFGPLVMFGSGGIEVEGIKDVAFALAPLTQRDVEYLLENTWAGKKLKGFRKLLPADRSAVVDALMRLAQLASDFPQIKEIEINPLRVLAEGSGAFALDVRAGLS
ncbi:MAG: acetate--CoA ligase family protein [Chloroflexota bacterium]